MLAFLIFVLAIQVFKRKFLAIDYLKKQMKRVGGKLVACCR